jgi:hypothetical protein
MATKIAGYVATDEFRAAPAKKYTATSLWMSRQLRAACSVDQQCLF